MMDMIKKDKKGTILIISLWVIAILTLFAVSVGRRSAISLKLTSYNVDRLKAYFLARAAVLRGLAEKGLELKSGRASAIDALSQSWANNQDLFCDHKLGGGDYTLGYEYTEEETGKKKPTILYGLMDEQSRININHAPMETIANLIESFDIDQDEAEEMAAAIVDWRDEDELVISSAVGNFNGAEDDYYQGLSVSYHCKNSSFDTIYELVLVRGITREIFGKLKSYITIYGEGKVNINTAGERVLDAVFGPGVPNLASKIIRYRYGDDGKIGTEDDRWFCWGAYIIEREDRLAEIKNLQEASWYANIYGITTEEYGRIRELITGSGSQLCVSSKAYRAIAKGEVKKVKASIEAVYLFEEKDRPPEVKFWYQG